jgi:hypothetical protein
VYVAQQQLTVCDTPGFEDSRRVEIDIANSIAVANAIKVCKSVKPVLLISFYEFKEGRGNAIRATLTLITKLMKDFESNQKSMLIFFTHVPNDKNEDFLRAELDNLLDASDIKS